MFYIKKLIFALKKLSKKIKGNSINALVQNFAIFVSGRSQLVAPDPKKSATPTAQRNNLEYGSRKQTERF